MKKKKVRGADLARKWGLDVVQAKYSEWGNWYALLTSFPAALLDTNGYILIQDELALRSHPQIRVTKQINIPDRISSLPEYIQVCGFLPEEITDYVKVPEGARVSVMVNRYERKSANRRECLKYHGYSCSVCGFAMAEIYGPMASELIHVHHCIPLSEIGEEYVLDPVTDLCPVCPNCHAFLHLSSPPMSVNEAKGIIEGGLKRPRTE